MAWIEQFLFEARGMEALGVLIASLVGKGGKRRKLIDVEETVLLEVVKCLRVLLNTAVSVFHTCKYDGISLSITN